MAPASGQRSAWGVVALSLLTVVSLLLPWFQVLLSRRSTVGLLSDAAALDLLSSTTTALIICALIAVPALAAGALLAAAVPRVRLVGWLGLPMGLIIPAALLLIAIKLPGVVLWGAWLAVASGVGTTGVAALLLHATRVGSREPSG